MQRESVKILKKICSKYAYLLIPVLIGLSALHVLVNNDFILHGINASDLNGNLGGLGYMIHMLKIEGKLPMWNPYLGHGIPTLADPLNIFFSPFIFIPYLLFEYKRATEVFVYATTLFSFIAMYYSLVKTSRDKLLSIIGAITYAFSGYAAAQLVSGHIEKTISYALLPLLILTLLWIIEKPRILFALIHGFVLLTLFLSGGIYELFYYYLGLGGVVTVVVFHSALKRSWNYGAQVVAMIGVGSLTWVALGAFKLIPFLESRSFMDRVIDPLKGSMSISKILYSLSTPPFESWFKNINEITPFPWWEHYAYVGLGILLVIGVCFAYFINRAVSREARKGESFRIVVLVVLFFVNVLYACLDSIRFNPVRLILEQLAFTRQFAIPSRSLSYTVTYLFFFLGVLWPSIRTRKVIKVAMMCTLCLNCCAVVYAFHVVTTPVIGLRSFQKVIPLSEDIVQKLKSDKTDYFIAQHPFFDLQPSTFELITHGIRILNPNYGFGLRGSTQIDFSRAEFMNVPYTGPSPKYIIYPKESVPLSISKLEVVDRSHFTLFRNERYTPVAYETDKINASFPTLAPEQDIYTVSFENDVYTVSSDKSGENDILMLLVSKHAAWEAYSNNKRVNLLDGNFLAVKKSQGKQQYQFKYNSQSVKLGVFISTSFLLMLIVLMVKMRIWKRS